MKSKETSRFKGVADSLMKKARETRNVVVGVLIMIQLLFFLSRNHLLLCGYFNLAFSS